MALSSAHICKNWGSGNSRSSFVSMSLAFAPLKQLRFALSLLWIGLFFGQDMAAQVARRSSSSTPSKSEAAVDMSHWPNLLRLAWNHSTKIEGDDDVVHSFQLATVIRLVEGGHLEQAVGIVKKLGGHRKFIGLAECAESAARMNQMDLAHVLLKQAEEGLKVVGLARIDALRLKLVSAYAAAGLEDMAVAAAAEVLDPELRGTAVAARLKGVLPKDCDQAVSQLSELSAAKADASAAELFYRAKGLIEVLWVWTNSGLQLGEENSVKFCKQAFNLARASNLDMTDILLDATDLLLNEGYQEAASELIQPLRMSVPSMNWGVENTPARLFRLLMVEERLGRGEDAEAAKERARSILSGLEEDQVCEGHFLAGSVLWRMAETAEATLAWKVMLDKAAENPNANVWHSAMAKVLIEMDRLGDKAKAFTSVLNRFVPEKVAVKGKEND